MIANVKHIFDRIYFNDPTRFWIVFWFVVSFISIVSAYSLWTYFPKGSYYKLIALGFVSTWRHVYLKSKGNWSIAYFVLWLASCNNLFDETFGDNKLMESNDYIGFLLIVFITLVQRKKWTR